MSAIVKYQNKKTRIVKNLGWLLRHWTDVQALKFVERLDGESFFQAYSWPLISAPFQYQTDYSDFVIFLHWVNRPVFRGLPLTVIISSNGFCVGYFQFFVGDDNFKKFVQEKENQK